ncbi:MAG: triose-phosphate isomerase, partial [Patescibacteria group bacterium]
NWKNKPVSLEEAGDILVGLKRKAQVFKKIKTFIAPPFVYFESVSEKAGGFARLASQGMPLVLSGVHTGAIIPEMLQSFGVRMAIIGHSEERELGETNELISQKVKVALKYAITPLVCIGEKERDHEGEYLEFLRKELKFSLEGIKRSHFAKATWDKKDEIGLMVAYEPIWAIGKSARNAMSPSDLAEMTVFIRRVLTDLFGRKTAEHIPILYGGSVEPANARFLMKESGVNGFLVGHVSLDAKKFAEIAKALI